ncbi:MAG: tetratricopeptide repeat protein [Deltaproteobacteria bacterium]|jgi:tetratricopeptide (TPR) repeat protein|nr:tetratricopeptide repeat protein [Deltaproteobacteria bacterium]
MFQKLKHKNIFTDLIRYGAVLMCLLFSSASLVAAGEPITESAKKELLRQGQEFFHQATEMSVSNPEAAKDLYTKALLRLNRLTEEGGIRNGKLFYNIGNIYFLLEDTGRAILNYRRAEQYIPNDSNLAKNLAYARIMRQDKLVIKDQRKIQQTLFFFHYDLDTKTRLVIFGISYLLLWVIAGVKIFSIRPYTNWVLGVSILFTLIFGSSLCIEQYQSARNMEGVILAPEVIARQGEADSYQPSFKEPLHAGTEFILQEDRNSWWQIELPDGNKCWIPSHSGELVRK